ncbi:hypothetical protein Pcinc_030597 [Petrolisthes cinctipes]|uniref:Uncharacterized protein n=1 Tax=Petrolisthes cinctipes TaxID=88211 RepID=A0AAE1EY34_PETCI|nr:hypothetical protein Pcinc_030597 [Petrolisthes cinctipes]
MEGLALGLVHSNRDVWGVVRCSVCPQVDYSLRYGHGTAGKRGIEGFPLFCQCSYFLWPLLWVGMIGTLVVSIMTETTAAGVLVPTSLQGLSAGTILYVTFCEGPGAREGQAEPWLREDVDLPDRVCVHGVDAGVGFHGGG